MNPSGNDTTFRVYLTLPSLSTQTSASPSHPSEALENVGNGGNGAKGKGKETYLICHHGGGASGLSFAPLAKSITERSGGELGVIAYDCRGHGKSSQDMSCLITHLDIGKTRSEGGQERDRDLSLSTLLSDLLGIIRHLFPDPTQAPSFLVRVSSTYHADSSFLVIPWEPHQSYQHRQFFNKKATRSLV